MRVIVNNIVLYYWKFAKRIDLGYSSNIQKRKVIMRNDGFVSLLDCSNCTTSLCIFIIKHAYTLNIYNEKESENVTRDENTL